MENKTKYSIIFFFALIFIFPNYASAALGSTILVQGVLTNELIDNEKGYALIKDSLGQKFLLPKKYLEDKLKINFKKLPSPILFEMKIEEFNQFHSECIKKYEKHRWQKKCPSRIN